MHEKARPQHVLKKAIPYILIGCIFTSAQALFAKLLENNVSIPFLVFARCLINSVILTLWIVCSRSTVSFRTILRSRKKRLLLARGLFGTMGIYGFYIALKFISLSSAIVLMYSIPIFVPIVSRVWLKLKIFPKIYIGIVIAFLGIILILRPGTDVFNIGGFIAIFGAIMGAISTLCIRLLHYEEPKERILAYYFYIALMVSTMVLLFSEEAIPRLNLEMIIYLLLVGISSTLFVFFLTLATKYAPSRLISPFLYASVVFSMIPDIYIFHKKPSIYFMLGTLLIVIGTIYLVKSYPKNDLVYHEKKKK